MIVLPCRFFASDLEARVQSLYQPTQKIVAGKVHAMNHDKLVDGERLIHGDKAVLLLLNRFIDLRS